MRFRIVVYAEGDGELAGLVSRLPAPGAALGAEHEGALHRLVRRCVLEQRANAAVEFVSPLRTAKGTTVVGSSLRDRPKELARLLTWLDPLRRPDLAVVAVDEDGEPSKRATLESDVRGVALPTAIAVPVPEFEAWLLADVEAAARVLDRRLDEPKSTASMEPGEAKSLFLRWCGDTEGTSVFDEATRDARRLARAEILSAARLELLRRQRSFAAFEKSLRAALVAARK